MTQESNERIMIFIDGSNLFWGMRYYNEEHNSNLKLDYNKLISNLASGRVLLKKSFYGSMPQPKRKSQISFHELLRHNGFDVIIYPLKRRRKPNGDKPNVEKSVDVAMAIDFVNSARDDDFDTGILVTGDGDFVQAVNRVTSIGKRVEVASFGNNLSKDLKRSADEIVFLDKIVGKLKR